MAAYVDNKRFFEELVKYREARLKAQKENLPEPTPSNYIGLCFIKIAERLSTNRNFIGYTYRDEMISDGIENAVMAIHNFDPEKSKNPFAYFTQIIWFAFIRRIAKEKKQTYIKYTQFQNMNITGELFAGEDIPGLNINVDNEFMDEMVKNFEESKRKKDEKTKAKKKKGLEVFIEEDAEKFIDEDTLSENKLEVADIEDFEDDVDRKESR